MLKLFTMSILLIINKIYFFYRKKKYQISEIWFRNGCKMWLDITYNRAYLCIGRNQLTHSKTILLIKGQNKNVNRALLYSFFRDNMG